MKRLIGLALLCLTTIMYGQENDSTYFWTQFEKGRSKCHDSDFYDAKVLLEQVLSEVKDSDYKDFDLEARIMTDIAWAYAGLRDKVSENIYIEAALKIYADNLSLESEEYAAILHDMALTQGGRRNFQYAIELLDSSNVIFKKYVPEMYNGGRASNLVSLGWIYREQNKYDKAIASLKEAVILLKLEGGERYTDLGTAHHILGYTLMYNGNYHEALPHLLKGKKLRAERIGTSHPLYNQSLQKISECYSYLGDYKNAHTYLDIIIATFQKENFENDNKEIQLDSIKSWYTLLQTYVSKGNIYLFKYRAQEKYDDLELNLIWYKKSIDAIQKILLFFPSKEGRFQLLKVYSYLFDYGVNNAVLLYEYYRDPKYLEQAFQISEANRGFSFLEAMHKGQSTENYNVPQELLKKESALNIKMQKFEQGNKKDITNSNDWIKLNLELQKLQQKIKKEYPNYFNLQSNLIVPTVKEVQKKLSALDAVIKFYEGNGKVFTFVISKDSASIYTIENQEEYNRVLSRLIKSISENPLTSNTSSRILKEDSKLIYNWLIKPLDPLLVSKQNIVIIPHKKLNYLPFEVLIKEDTILNDSKYFVQNFAISYDYSCTSLFSKRNKSASSISPYHGIAPGIRKDNMTDESINEIKMAHEIWGGKYSIYKNATRKNVLKGLKKANIVHIAAHSILDTSDISKFAIILNGNKNENKKDSLFIEDIYLSNINSELIILSGCQTADGLLKAGEGVLSLSNAFKYAGAESLTCSLWETENSISTEIITNYIANLKNKQPKDEALQSAKIQFLESADPLLKHPFFWSTFVNIGNQNAILKFENNHSYTSNNYKIGIGFLFCCLVFLVIAKKKK